MDFTEDYFGGNCPVQGEGTICGHPWYFRARGEDWSLVVGKDGGDFALDCEIWDYSQHYGAAWPDAGWMPIDEAKGYAVGALIKFLRHKNNGWVR